MISPLELVQNRFLVLNYILVRLDGSAVDARSSWIAVAGDVDWLIILVAQVCHVVMNDLHLRDIVWA